MSIPLWPDGDNMFLHNILHPLPLHPPLTRLYGITMQKTITWLNWTKYVHPKKIWLVIQLTFCNTFMIKTNHTQLPGPSTLTHEINCILLLDYKISTTQVAESQVCATEKQTLWIPHIFSIFLNITAKISLQLSAYLTMNIIYSTGHRGTPDIHNISEAGASSTLRWLVVTGCDCRIERFCIWDLGFSWQCWTRVQSSVIWRYVEWSYPTT
jgi:hypothetical protein